MSRMKDVLDDNDHKLKLVPLLIATCAGALAVMIIGNALVGRHRIQPGAEGQSQQIGAVSQEGTIILRYDPAVESAQRALLAAGLYKGAIDGVNGLRTRQAIQIYQHANGLPPTGEATDALVNHIRFTNKLLQAAQFTGSVSPVNVPAPASSPAFSPVAPIAQAISREKELKVRKVQVALLGLGYDVNKVDGQVNEDTRAAILKYEMDNGLEMTGEVGNGLMKALKVK